MDIYQRLMQDHKLQKDLAAKIMKTSGNSETRQSLFQEFKAEVENHEAAEEQSLYATLIEKPAGQEKAQHSIAEHKEASDLIEELDKMDMSGGGWIQNLSSSRTSLNITSMKKRVRCSSWRDF